jgi:hypothetical protein
MILPKARGNKEFKSHQMGGRLTKRQAILAKCADCMGNYVDGRIDCEMPECPLYPFSPYGSFKSDTPKKPYYGGFKPRNKARIHTLEDQVSVDAEIRV